MMTPVRVVFDCNVLLQALASPRGPSGVCFELVVRGEALLFISPIVLAELWSVSARTNVIRKLRLTPDRVSEFLQAVTALATMLAGFPESFTYERDAKDGKPRVADSQRIGRPPR